MHLPSQKHHIGDAGEASICSKTAPAAHVGKRGAGERESELHDSNLERHMKSLAVLKCCAKHTHTCCPSTRGVAISMDLEHGHRVRVSHHLWQLVYPPCAPPLLTESYTAIRSIATCTHGLLPLCHALSNTHGTFTHERGRCGLCADSARPPHRACSHRPD